MPLRRLATLCCIVCLLLALVGPHFARHGWGDIEALAGVCERWRHHPAGTIAIIIVLACWLWQPRSNG